ncbi:CLUMA_CG001984, isoform A [Clunio marinus]|uniref:CLUMA_CG001984, isoform A n=1 Tax=Clunio marinus TaxID=568069 RepID=A0A1J1HJV8_9DIPT|nr:CLUMA_CG001984, isoform A [Clunio marinus]
MSCSVHSEKNIQQQSNETEVPAVLPEKENEKEGKTSTSDEIFLKGAALLKSLLSTPTVTLPVNEKMITTTEVNDETLSLKKILYQLDKDAKDNHQTEIGIANEQMTASQNETQNDDDDSRLIIDISDEEKGSGTETKTKGKSMPSLKTSNTTEKKYKKKFLRPVPLEPFVPIKPLPKHLTKTHQNPNVLPTSITYNLEPDARSNTESRVKIDILAPSNNQTEVPSSTERYSKSTNYQSPSKCSKMSSMDELQLISREIDKQMNKKTIEVLEIIKDCLSGLLEKNTFLTNLRDASDTSLSDLVSIARKLIKRHKFEANPNNKEFMRIKFLHFPTTSSDFVSYFDNLLPSLTKEKFINMIKFYEIIIKEMLNLNKTKILQYLIDFMVIRKNSQLDLLNYNFQISSAPNLKQPNSSLSKFQLPDSTQHPSERRPIRLADTSYNFIIRSDPIYLLAGSTFATNHRDVISCQMSSHIQMRSYERRPFDNNVLKGRRIGRRLMRSPSDDKISKEFMRVSFPMTPQSEPGTPLQQIQKMRPPTPIIVESETPPPSLPSEPPSPPQHRILKPQILSNTLITPANIEVENTSTNGVKDVPTTVPEEVQDISKIIPQTSNSPAKTLELRLEPDLTNSLQNGQITIQEIQTLNQNGTEIIPTSILKGTVQRKPNEEKSGEDGVKESTSSVEIKKFMPRGVSHDEQSNAPKLQKRRQSCHERIMMNETDEAATIAQNRPRMPQYQVAQRSPMRSPLKPTHQPLNYQYYQNQFERQLRKHGFDHRIENHQESSRPLELVSHIPPERYHQQEPHRQPDRQHYVNHLQPKPIRHTVEEKQPHQPQPQRMQPQRINPDQHHAMMAAAYHQLQTLHRDPTTLTSQQYAEHLKQLDNLKHIQPSAFQTYQRSLEQRPQPDYFNTQDNHQPPPHTSPIQYQISSSSSREDSPVSYDAIHKEQSLQRKLKYKGKSAKYVEPSLMAKPFYNPAHSTYYSEPYALTKGKVGTPTSPPANSIAFHQNEQQRSRSPVERNFLDAAAANSQHFHWMMAQNQAHGQSQLQRPIPRPPVPTFIDPKVNGASQLHPLNFQDQPTEFLRHYYANQKNY